MLNHEFNLWVWGSNSQRLCDLKYSQMNNAFNEILAECYVVSLVFENTGPEARVSSAEDEFGQCPSRAARLGERGRWGRGAVQW